MTTETTKTYAEIGIPINPFPGLRPFEFDESHLFFGREGQSEQLIDKLGRTRFLAVVGTSGSGKSSLVRAGLLPAVLGGFMTSAGSDWRIAIMRPGNDPIGNLARALNATDVFGSEIAENAALQTALAEATLRRGGRGLVDTVRQSVVAENENLLVVVDQFEELFRFARVAEGEQYQNEAAAFVKLLLEASREREIPIYVVLTMRSDYLGDCSQFWDLPEAINESQYLIPRLTRDQLREAISGPVAVGEGKITPRLVNRLLNDVGDDQDQLPVLQHLLMRVWDESKEKQLEVDVKDQNATARSPHKEVHKGEVLDLCCYDAVGGMAKALSLHADEAFNELPDERHREGAEKLFKGLTEKGPDNREIRRPVTLGEICAMTGAIMTEAVTVIDTFRQPGRSFLMPPTSVALNSESLIDISHESLIRGWTRLKSWVEEEARSARIYHRLAETAVLHKEGGAGLWRDPDLQVALTWRDESRPNEVWAKRYHPEFGLAISFLDESVAARDEDFNEKETQRKRAIRRTRLTASVFAFLFLVSLVALVFANQQRVRANQQTAIANQQTVRANGLLDDVKRNAEAAKNNAVREEQERFAKQEAEEQRKISEMHAREAEELRKDALDQKGIAEQQTAKLIKLEEKARNEATEANEINSLAKEIVDALGREEVDVDEVITKATKQLDYYRKREDPRGIYESQMILGPAFLKKGQPAEARAAEAEAEDIVDAWDDPISNRIRHEIATVLSEAFMKEADMKAGEERTRDLGEALRSAKYALSIQESPLDPEDPALIPDLNNLASVTERLGGDSEIFHVRIFNIQKKVVKEGNLRLVTYLNDLVTFYQARGNFAKAEAHLNELLAIQQSISPANDPQVVASLNRLVDLYRFENKDTEADQLVKKIQSLQGKLTILRRGTSGPEVKNLQIELRKLGFFQDSPDENFGESTEAAVILFQNSRGLVADGIAGPQTLALLDQPKSISVGTLEIQTELQKLGFYSGTLDGDFGMRTKAALMNFQKSKGLVEDGTANQETLEALGLVTPAYGPAVTGKVTIKIVANMFPGTPIDNIKANLPYVLRALEDAGLSDKDMVLMALATIRVESPNFVPLAEMKSRLNTSPDGHPFDLYDNRAGNQGPPDGERFRGRGYFQLFGRVNYKKYGDAIGLGNQLIENPDLANQPDISAKLFASFLKDIERPLRAAFRAGDPKAARRRFSGGYSNLSEFTRALQTGESLLQ